MIITNLFTTFNMDKNYNFNIENLNEDTIKLLSLIDLNYWINTEKYEKITKFF